MRAMRVGRAVHHAPAIRRNPSTLGKQAAWR
jgi:hypothetical protein